MNRCLTLLSAVTGNWRRVMVKLTPVVVALALAPRVVAEETAPAAPAVAADRNEAIHHLLVAGEAHRSAVENRDRLSRGLAMHLERLSGLRQRLAYAREQVDVQTRQVGQLMVEQAEQARLDVATAALQAVEQQAIELYRLVDRADRQIAFAREAIGEARQRVDEADARVGALRREALAMPAKPGDPEIDPLLRRIAGNEQDPEAPPERHVDVCPWCQEKRR